MGFSNFDINDLVFAARHGRDGVVRDLLRAGANVNTVGNVHGDTALIAAVIGNHTETVKVLLDNGADVNAREEAGYTSLMRAVTLEYVSIIKLLLDAGADVNARNDWGETVLMHAVLSNHTNVVGMLLKAGANTDAADNKGRTALDIALEGRSRTLSWRKMIYVIGSRKRYNVELAQMLLPN